MAACWRERPTAPPNSSTSSSSTRRAPAHGERQHTASASTPDARAAPARRPKHHEPPGRRRCPRQDGQRRRRFTLARSTAARVRGRNVGRLPARGWHAPATDPALVRSRPRRSIVVLAARSAFSPSPARRHAVLWQQLRPQEASHNGRVAHAPPLEHEDPRQLPAGLQYRPHCDTLVARARARARP